MILVPFIPPLPDETTLSWTGRLAQKHANIGCADFLRMLVLIQKHVMETTIFCVDRLAKLTGVPRDRIAACGIQRFGERALHHRGQYFGTSFASRKFTTYCPRCLLADSLPESPSQGLRVGRVAWSFRSVQVCPEHRIKLVRRANTSFTDQFQDMNLVAPKNSELEAEADSAVTKNTSAMQQYTQRRFAGFLESPWLDSQQIDLGLKACEMLGACLLFGAHGEFDKLSADEMTEAGDVGFEVVSKGQQGIGEALDQIAAKSFEVKLSGGPQAAFGRLYQWLQFNRSKKPRGPIQEAVRDHILGTMHIPAGTKLFGEIVEERRRHSVYSLAKYSGLDARTLNRALVRTGVLLHEDEDEVDPLVSFPAEVGEKLATRINQSLPIIKLPGYLNCNRTQAEMMVKQGLISQIAPQAHKIGGVLTNVATEDLDDFLIKFRSGGKPVSFPSPGMTNVIAASEIARQTVTDIVRMVIDRKLSKLEVLDADLKFRSVLVDPAEVRSVADMELAKLGLTAHEVAEILGIFPSGLRHLRTNFDREGKPFIAASEAKNSRGTIYHRYKIEAVKMFQQNYATLTVLAAEAGVSSKTMARRLSQCGVYPIIDRQLLNAAMYHRPEISKCHVL